METVYVETTVIGNIAGRVHPDPIIAARQRETRDWWDSATAAYQLAISQLVVDECAAGDAAAAAERLAVLKMLGVLPTTDAARGLAKALVSTGAVPASEPRDALHIAVAATSGVEYLVTWNFKHIANATLRSKIEQTCRDEGFRPPVICTPLELPGENDG